MTDTADQTETTEPAEGLDPEEGQILTRISELEAEIDGLRASLEDARRMKQILYLSNAELRDELVQFLVSRLGIQARVAPDNKDGFWLGPDTPGQEWGFGQVRDEATGNVTREMVARVLLDRHDADKPDYFPALLVVNTFQGSEDMAERDQPVPPDVCRRAFEDHVMVVRVLDLVRLRNKDLTGPQGAKDFQESVNAGGGWFEVNAALASKINFE